MFEVQLFRCPTYIAQLLILICNLGLIGLINEAWLFPCFGRLPHLALCPHPDLHKSRFSTTLEHLSATPWPFFLYHYIISLHIPCNLIFFIRRSLPLLATGEWQSVNLNNGHFARGLRGNKDKIYTTHARKVGAGGECMKLRHISLVHATTVLIPVVFKRFSQFPVPT